MEDEKMPERQIRKRKKGILTKSLILNVAAESFARKGYDNVSIREIAKCVGVKESSIYNHFTNKQEILEVLLHEFSVHAPDSRPSLEQLEAMTETMSLKEIFKNIMFSVGRNIDELLFNTSIIIQCERFRTPLAADAYRNYIVEEPVLYYQNLIAMMIRKNKIQKKNAFIQIKHYVYAANAVSQEYFMAKNGLGDVDKAVGLMLETLDFYCDLIEEKK